ncbi:MAG: ABC transporter permease [Thermodesulfobacteriota bacterium]
MNYLPPNLLTVLKVSFRALKTNKIRSALTTLGIIIGVAAVISLIALTQGADQMINQQLTSLGGKSLFVNPGKWDVGVQKDAINLTNNDVTAIEEIPVVKYASPILDFGDKIIWGNKSWYTAIVGTSPDFVFINDWYPDQGVFFNTDDVQNIAQVCVIGKTVANNVFRNTNPIGKSLRIGSSSFKVIGILSTLGQTTSGRDQDDLVVIPYTTYQKRIIGSNSVDKIFVSVKSPENLQAAEVQIRDLLRERHNIGTGEDDSFYIKSQFGIVQKIFSISSIMGILLGSIASISLIVGGIGIMNIMLVSVGERTKEIGIRMAVGAREKDILAQFLTEAIVLSLAGGVIGTILGILVSKIATSLTGWPSIISIEAIMMAFGFSATIGIFFGIYPARKASKLNPIEALRYE